MPHIAAIILAAGRSARLGRPKQLEPVHGEPLLRRTARIALASRTRTVHVILGHQADSISQILQDLPVTILQNDAWPEGVASSIRAGITTAEGCDAALILPCDLPLLDTAHLDALIEAYESGAPIAASRWDDVTGAPALFDRRFFPELQALTGDQGAKVLLRKHANLVHAVPFPAGAFDIDEAADLKKLNLPQS